MKKRKLLEHQSGNLEYLSRHFMPTLHAAFPRGRELRKMPSHRRIAQLTTQENLYCMYNFYCLLYLFFWRCIIYINILKTLRRIAINITCFKPTKIGVFQFIVPRYLLSSSLSLSLDVTLTNIWWNIWENAPVDKANSVLFLSLRLEGPFCSCFSFSPSLSLTFPSLHYLILIL